jgi:hypothetical protein
MEELLAFVTARQKLSFSYGRFKPRERTLGTYLIGVGPGVGLDAAK